jgi:hypothetical protein
MHRDRGFRPRLFTQLPFGEPGLVGPNGVRPWGDRSWPARGARVESLHYPDSGYLLNGIALTIFPPSWMVQAAPALRMQEGIRYIKECGSAKGSEVGPLKMRRAAGAGRSQPPRERLGLLFSVLFWSCPNSAQDPTQVTA